MMIVILSWFRYTILAPLLHRRWPRTETRKQSEPERHSHRSGAETGNNFQFVYRIQESIRSWIRKQFPIRQPNPGINPELNPEPETDPEDKKAFGLKTFLQISCEERRKKKMMMTNLYMRKISKLADYYWRNWISDVPLRPWVEELKW